MRRVGNSCAQKSRASGIAPPQRRDTAAGEFEAWLESEEARWSTRPRLGNAGRNISCPHPAERCHRGRRSGQGHAGPAFHHQVHLRSDEALRSSKPANPSASPPGFPCPQRTPASPSPAKSPPSGPKRTTTMTTRPATRPAGASMSTPASHSSACRRQEHDLVRGSNVERVTAKTVDAPDVHLRRQPRPERPCDLRQRQNGDQCQRRRRRRRAERRLPQSRAAAHWAAALSPIFASSIAQLRQEEARILASWSTIRAAAVEDRRATLRRRAGCAAGSTI